VWKFLVLRRILGSIIALVNDCGQCELSAWLSGIKEDRNCSVICGNCWQSAGKKKADKKRRLL